VFFWFLSQHLQETTLSDPSVAYRLLLVTPQGDSKIEFLKLFFSKILALLSAMKDVYLEPVVKTIF
jgi:hypothetical protein